MQSGIFKGPITFDESPGGLVTYPGHIPVSGGNTIFFIPVHSMNVNPHAGGGVYPATSGDYPGGQDTQGIIFDHRESSGQLSSGAGMVLPSVGVVANKIVLLKHMIKLKFLRIQISTIHLAAMLFRL